MNLPEIHVALPGWAQRRLDFERVYHGDRDRMRIAIELALGNVEQKSGGPFGAAIFDDSTGRLVAAGVNLVVPLNNSALHAEIVAFMLAQARLGTYSLSAPGLGPHMLYASCEPCAMCLGATLWSGVQRVVSGATRADANRVAFDEGPVFPASYEYLRARGIAFTAGVLRDEARAVLELYRAGGGIIYNG